MDKWAITTNIPPAGSDNIDVEDMLAFTRALRHQPDKAEIKVGSMAAFKAWCEHHFGPTVKAKPHEKLSPPSLMGLPVTVFDPLPVNRAALLVNGEVQTIIDLDLPTHRRER